MTCELEILMFIFCLSVQGDQDTVAGIIEVVAIPEAEWHLDYITPRAYCLRKDGQCKPAIFSKAVDSKRVSKFI